MVVYRGTDWEWNTHSSDLKIQGSDGLFGVGEGWGGEVIDM